MSAIENSAGTLLPLPIKIAESFPFIFPSYFEGFGLPPLEALSCGAPVIISNKTCLPEIYEDCAHYINPDVYDVDLNKILGQPVASPEKLLEKYTLQNTARRLLSVINEVIKVV